MLSRPVPIPPTPMKPRTTLSFAPTGPVRLGAGSSALADAPAPAASAEAARK